MKQKLADGPLKEEDLMESYEAGTLAPEIQSEIGELSEEEKKIWDEGAYPARVAGIIQKCTQASELEWRLTKKSLTDAKKIQEDALDKVVKEIQKQPDARRQLAALALNLSVDYSAAVDGEDGAYKTLGAALNDEILHETSLSQDAPDYMDQLDACRAKHHRNSSSLLQCASSSMSS